MKSTRLLDLFKVRIAFEKKLLADGLSPDEAKKAANSMQSADLTQAHKDLARHPKLIFINKQTGTIEGYTREDFSTLEKSDNFLNAVAGNNDLLYQYLCQYFHQGGFMHLSELLMAYYYAPDTRFITDGRVGTFILEKDGSLIFEEKFDVTAIHSPDAVSHATPESPITTLTLRSQLQVKDGKIAHTFAELKLDLHDNSAKKFFAPFENRLKTLLSRLETYIKTLFEKSKNEFSHGIRKLKKPHNKPD